jgi:uncharacterized membrane protein
MAIVADAGSSDAHGVLTNAGGMGAPQVRKIEVADVLECIEQGVRDFARAPQYGLFFGAVYAVGGLMILWLSVSLGYFYLVYPLVMGFALFAPFGAAGVYEVSRRLESGEPLSWSAVLGAVWGRSARELGWLALVSMFTFIIWLDIAMFVFLAFYGISIPSFSQLFAQVVSTPYGLLFLLVGNGLGAVIALVVFSFTVVSPPLLVDRDIDFITAMSTSVRAVVTNPKPMLVWAIVIGADLAIAFATFFVALLVVFPILGHTTWRLYRRVIDPV